MCIRDSNGGEPVQLGHHHVNEYQVDVLGHGQVQSLHAVVGLEHVVAQMCIRDRASSFFPGLGLPSSTTTLTGRPWARWALAAAWAAISPAAPAPMMAISQRSITNLPAKMERPKALFPIVQGAGGILFLF